MKSTEAIKEQTGRLGRQGDVARNVASKSGRSIRMSGEVLGWLGSLAYTVKSEIVDSAASFERFRTALETVEGSSGKARSSMDWISSFAVKTPFELEQVRDAFVKLRSDGMDPTQGLLHVLGDASAATGKPLMQAVAAMAGAMSGDNGGLKEFGIEARAAEGGLPGQQTGKIRYEYTVDGETKAAEAMAGDRAQIQQVLGGILDVKFGGAMAEESKTFMGMLGNLADQWTRFRNMVMASGAFDFLKGRLRALLDTLDRMAADGSLQQIAEQVGTRVVAAFRAAEEAIGQLWPWVVRIGEALSWAAGRPRSGAGWRPAGCWSGSGAGSGELPTLVWRAVFDVVIEFFCEVFEAVRRRIDEGLQDTGQHKHPEDPVEFRHYSDEEKEQDQEDVFDGVFEEGLHAGIVTWRT